MPPRDRKPITVRLSPAATERLDAMRAGAVGVQVGTLFALCAESGLTQAPRELLLDRLRTGDLSVRNDPRAGPTGFPFKVVTAPGTVSQPEVHAERDRLCDLSCLRQPYERADGTVGYRCAGEPVHMFVRTGGPVDDTEGRRCLCNGLTATVGMGQHRKDGYDEPALFTLGEDLVGAHALGRHPQGWSAADAVAYLLEGLPAPSAVTPAGADLAAPATTCAVPTGFRAAPQDPIATTTLPRA